jgi:gas vesicle protein
MSDANEGMGMTPDRHGAGDHRLVLGIGVGTALGVAVGVLLAPRKGSELRHTVAGKAKQVASSCRDTIARGRRPMPLKI